MVTTIPEPLIEAETNGSHFADDTLKSFLAYKTNCLDSNFTNICTLSIQLTICQFGFRLWLGVEPGINFYLKQLMPKLHIYKLCRDKCSKLPQTNRCDVIVRFVKPIFYITLDKGKRQKCTIIHGKQIIKYILTRYSFTNCLLGINQLWRMWYYSKYLTSQQLFLFAFKDIFKIWVTHRDGVCHITIQWITTAVWKHNAILLGIVL